LTIFVKTAPVHAKRSGIPERFVFLLVWIEKVGINNNTGNAAGLVAPNDDRPVPGGYGPGR
jgi:hypothetical protein